MTLDCQGLTQRSLRMGVKMMQFVRSRPWETETYYAAHSTCGHALTRRLDSKLEHQQYTCQLFLIPMREIFFRVPRPPERGLGPSSKGTGASTNEAESLPLLRMCQRCTRWTCIVSSRSRRDSERRHLLIPHQSLPFQILQFPFDFDRNSAVLARRFSKRLTKSSSEITIGSSHSGNGGKVEDTGSVCHNKINMKS